MEKLSIFYIEVCIPSDLYYRDGGECSGRKERVPGVRETGPEWSVREVLPLGKFLREESLRSDV